MLDLLGPRHPARFCDGLSRRSFLRMGGLTLGGLSLPGILEAQERSGSPAAHKGIINVFLAGGPPHQGTWEIKTEAPLEIRGEFRAIDTNVSGIQICELFPKLAARMDRLAVIRTVVGGRNEHAAHVCYSGYSEEDFRKKNRPCMGSFLSKIQGPAEGGVPPFVNLSRETSHEPWRNSGEPGFLGPVHRAFLPHGEGLADMILNGIDAERLDDRKSLLAGLDRMRREIDASGELRSVDAYTERAFEVLTSSKVVEALDLEREDPRIRDRYGRGLPILKSGTHPAEWHTEQFLVARRLIQAGVRCVTLNFTTWDTHHDEAKRMRLSSPYLDLGLSALLDDLHEQGMIDDVTVIAWGEFGRTPMINKDAGRDHWPAVGSALLFGGGMRTGQVIGRTDRLGGEPAERPVHFHEVFATLYHNLGIDVSRTTVHDMEGQPQYLLDIRETMPELV